MLASRDPLLARALAALGPPPLWARTPGFATLVHIILEQQVSLASARAAFERLKAATNPLSPQGFLELSDAQLLKIGFSRQKAGYCRGLANDLLSGRLDLQALPALDDDQARRALLAVRGIGPWTAEVYLLMVLLRPDAWPSGDLALATGAQQTLGLAARPGRDELDALSQAWRPYRAAAARLIWHAYLSGYRREADQARSSATA
jgi:DNA-3-methyladenine glycosylase II